MRSALVFAVTIATASPAIVSAQQPTIPTSQATGTITLSLDDALRLVQSASQAIEVARSGVVRATGNRLQARSAYLPQLNATAGYTKTLESQFSSFAKSSGSSTPTGTGNGASTGTGTDTTKTGGGAAGGFDLSKTSFGATNQWAVGLNFSQNVFSGGRISAQNAAAEAGLRSANIEVDAQRAQASLDVTQAYYDAVLADQLVTIADSSVAETEALLAQTKVAKNVGNASEYELLRAQVTRDNQLPVAIQARANRQTAYLRLKQLLNLPLDNDVRLTSGIEGANGPTLPAEFANATMDTASADRAPVRQLDENVRVQEAQVRIARSERIPSLAIVSNYQRLYFPSNVFPQLNAGVNNWTVGLSTNFPIFDGGRIRGDELVAQAGLQQARAQREQTRQFAALDTRVALNQLQEAQSTWEASQGTAEQAQRAYAIDQVRYREGISTQTDLSQSRLLLEQALANRAQAARNLAVARVKLALLRDLPLSTTTGSTPSQAQQQQQQQQSQQNQQQRSNSTSAGGLSATGSPTGSSQP
jgi:outer membrane protein TolC